MNCKLQLERGRYPSLLFQIQGGEGGILIFIFILDVHLSLGERNTPGRARTTDITGREVSVIKFLRKTEVVGIEEKVLKIH